MNASPWGAADEIGRLNRMTPDTQAAILQRLDGRATYDLAVDYFLGMPAWVAAGDPTYEIWMTHTPSGTVNDDLSGAGRTANENNSYAGSAFSMYSHTGTHVCGLNHIGVDGRFWNGWTQEQHMGSRSWLVGGVYPPIVARGVLFDVAAEHGLERLPPSYAITPDDIDGDRVRPGDVVLIRTGQMTLWPDPDAFLATPPGLALDAARYLAEELDVMCVGLDCGGEALPSEPDTFLPVHAYLLAEAGMPVFENLWLEDLAHAGETEFAFVAAPHKLRGSTGCPGRPLALTVHG